MPVMKLAFLFFIGLFGPLVSFAADQGAFETWSKKTEWRRLLHMTPGLFGEKSSVQGGDFFLDPQGSIDAGAELRATYRKMFQSSKEENLKTQCRYLARRDFFLRLQPDLQNQIVTCPFSEEWLSRLNSTRVSLIFAAGYMNSAASSFGHTFLKLSNPENQGSKELLDYGINFAARTSDTEGALYALYGLTGYFPGNFALLPYHQMIRDYTNLEGRDLWEYDLNLTPIEIQRMLFHMLELEGSYFNYYFLDDNCSLMILKVLEIARPDLNLTEADEFFVIPLDTVKKVKPLIDQVRYRPSLETEWKQRREDLNSDQREQILNLEQDPAAFQLSDMDTKTLMATQSRLALKEIQSHDRWKDLNYFAAKERARRGFAKDEFQIRQPNSSPDQGHDSSLIEVGLLDQGKRSMLIGFRSAFHDQLSRDVGIPPFSHLEVLGFQWQASELNQIQLRRYRLLEMLSTRAVSRFDKPISWGAVVGADSQIESETRLRHQVMGRIGYSFDFWPEKIRWSNLVLMGATQDLDQNFQATPGFNSCLWILWTPHIRSLVQGEWRRFPSQTAAEVEFIQAFDLSDQLELRLNWQQQMLGSDLTVSKSISLVQNFLF